jgi:type IV secretory pathway TrbD component
MGLWFRYSLIRLGIFAGVFVLMVIFGIEWWVAGLFAIGISFLASYIFFWDQRQEMARQLGEKVQRRKKPAADPDADAEDRVIDGT